MFLYNAFIRICHNVINNKKIKQRKTLRKKGKFFGILVSNFITLWDRLNIISHHSHLLWLIWINKEFLETLKLSYAYEPKYFLSLNCCLNFSAFTIDRLWWWAQKFYINDYMNNSINTAKSIKSISPFDLNNFHQSNVWTIYVQPEALQLTTNFIPFGTNLCTFA